MFTLGKYSRADLTVSWTFAFVLVTPLLVFLVRLSWVTTCTLASCGLSELMVLFRLLVANAAFFCWTALLTKWLPLFRTAGSDWLVPRSRLPSPFVVVASSRAVWNVYRRYKTNRSNNFKPVEIEQFVLEIWWWCLNGAPKMNAIFIGRKPTEIALSYNKK